MFFFLRKLNPEGTVERYKARQVAQGYSHVYGEDSDEVFAPVARFESIRTVVSQVLNEEIKIHKTDVTAAFLNEEIYRRGRDIHEIARGLC